MSDIVTSIKFVEANIVHLEILQREFSSADYVIHLAALPSVQRSIDDPIASNNYNIDGTLNVLVAARDCGVEKVVYASSSAIYGDSPELPKRESFNPDPLSPYAVTKLAGEYYCKLFYNLYGLKTVSLRYFNVFGPRQDPHSDYAAVIPKFIEAFSKGHKPTIFGDGEQTRDFVYVGDIIRANLLACQSDLAAGKVVNIASGTKTSLNQLVAILGEIFNKDVDAVYAKLRQGGVQHSLADISEAKALLGYEPKYGLENGLKEMILK